VIVALLTDFGDRDCYVGVMKAVIASLAPGVQVLDLCHQVSPQAIDEGAYLLSTALAYLPEGSVVCAVVDPGVGTARRAIAVEAGGLRLVGPDNGLLTPALAAPGVLRARSIESPGVMRLHPSATFHGRDVFAPCAAHLARGLALDRVGPEIDPGGLVRLPERVPRVVHVDAFGNLVLGLGPDQLPPGTPFRVGQVPVTAWVRSYGEAPGGELVAYLGSSGRIEVAVVGGSAARYCGLARGAAVTLEEGGSE
jgi:S-adenosylmethionine hydrolase